MDEAFNVSGLCVVVGLGGLVIGVVGVVVVIRLLRERVEDVGGDRDGGNSGVEGAELVHAQGVDDDLPVAARLNGLNEGVVGGIKNFGGLESVGQSGGVGVASSDEFGVVHVARASDEKVSGVDVLEGGAHSGHGPEGVVGGSGESGDLAETG